MILETEIRSGNYYNRVDSLSGDKLGFHKWDSNDWYKVGECIDFFDNYEYIPLTEDILLKCGFEKIKLPKEGTYYGHSEYNFGNVVFKVDNQNTLNSNGSNKYFFLNKFRIKCEYLHTLQNLVFALTQKELTVQL